MKWQLSRDKKNLTFTFDTDEEKEFFYTSFSSLQQCSKEGYLNHLLQSPSLTLSVNLYEIRFQDLIALFQTICNPNERVNIVNRESLVTFLKTVKQARDPAIQTDTEKEASETESHNPPRIKRTKSSAHMFKPESDKDESETSDSLKKRRKQQASKKDEEELKKKQPAKESQIEELTTQLQQKDQTITELLTRVQSLQHSLAQSELRQRQMEAMFSSFLSGRLIIANLGQPTIHPSSFQPGGSNP